MMIRGWLFSLSALLLLGCGPDDAALGGAEVPGALADTSEQMAVETAAPIEEDADEDFRETMAFAAEHDLAERPVGEIMLALGERFLGRPYIVGPLDGFGEEVLVARLDRFDCFTFVEAMLAMARGITAGDSTYAGYLRRTEELRYRNQSMDDYCSRLHYFTDWIRTNADRGLVQDLTEEMGGHPFPHQYGFMTANRESYEALVDAAQFRCIGEIERDLNARIDLYFIPQNEIRQAYAHLQPGDILSMTTSVDGLDVSHTGLAYPNDEGGFGMMHASTDGGVKIDRDLQEYVERIRIQNGVIVARPTGR